MFYCKLLESRVESAGKRLSVVEAAEHSQSLIDISTMIKVSGVTWWERAHQHTTKPELKVVLRPGCTEREREKEHSVHRSIGLLE